MARVSVFLICVIQTGFFMGGGSKFNRGHIVFYDNFTYVFEPQK